MFEGFSLPDVATVSRRTVLSALIVGAGGLVVCVVLGAFLVGVGLCVGLGLGLFNFRLIQRSVVKVGARAGENKRRPLATNTVGRLAVITALVLGLLFISFPLGFGVMAGLAAFQLMLLVNVARAMAKMGSGGLGGISALRGAGLSGLAGFDDEDDDVGGAGAGGRPAVEAVAVPDEHEAEG